MIKWRENGILELRPFTIPPLFRFSFLFGFCFLFVFLLNCYLICVFFFSFVCFYFFICVWTLWATIPLLSDVLLSYPRGSINLFCELPYLQTRWMCLQIVFFIKLSGQLQTSRCTQIQHSGHLSWRFCSLQALISFETLYLLIPSSPRKSQVLSSSTLTGGIWEGQGARMPLMYQVEILPSP